MSEPTPAHGESSIVPDSVLDELRSAFEGGRATSLGSDNAMVVATRVDDVVDLTSAMPGPPVSNAASSSSFAALPSEPAANARPPRRRNEKVKGGGRSRRRDRNDAAEGAPPGSSAWLEAQEFAQIPAPGTTIMIGGHDDFADAVYLDNGVDDAVSGTIVLGGELDSSGAFDAVAPPSRSMDPRVRARRIAVKRALGRKRLIWMGAIALAVVLVVTALAVFASSLFAVQRVDVTGDVYTDQQQLQKIIDEIVGQPILLVDTFAIERQLELIPWVERAIVTTYFPHSVGIDLRERQPLATFKGSDGRYRVIDREGRVLDLLDNRPIDYFLITGQAPDADPGAFAGAVFAHAAQLGSALPAEIRSITESLTVDAASGDLGMELQPGVEVRLGGFADLDAKLARLLQRMHDPNGLVGVTALDVSTDSLSETRG